MIVNLVFVNLEAHPKYMDLEIAFIFNGNKQKPILRVEYGRDAKLLFRSPIHRSHNSNQQLFS
jgi:hypothetical protein